MSDFDGVFCFRLTILVVAITNIKETYKIRKNWQGDPCSPQAYSWEGLNCSYHAYESLRRITTL